MIDKYTINRIFDAAQIVDVVSDFISLKKRGVNYVGLCPFHADKSPSFYVSPSKNICKCFACGEGGTSVQFIMKHEQVTYVEALKYLAKKYGIEVKERELTDAEKQLNSDRESMMIVSSWAQKFFASRLFEHIEGRTVGLPYFAERGFTTKTIKKFQLGYSLENRQDLYRSAMEHGFKEEFLLSTGLVYKRENDNSFVDRFHGRVIFPIHTLSGKVVAFGGRILGKKENVGKYVNSPESEIYHKSDEVYGLYFAKQAIQKADKCYLVEGYTDVISMSQSGVENVVSSSGTSLTIGQIRLIRRFTSNITVIYDGDAAGIKAAIRGIDMLLKESMNVKIVLLPEGEDPDSFARSHNSFDFTLYVNEHEVDFIRFKADLMMKEAKNDPIKKIAVIKDMMESVAIIPDNIVRSVYIKECSQIMDEREQILIEEVRKIRERNARKPQSSPTERSLPEITKPADSPENNASKEPAEAEVVVKTPVEQIIAPQKHNPLKKFESLLVCYIIRFGERELFPGIRVAEYINNELIVDGIGFRTPIYQQVLDEAVGQCSDRDFIAHTYFLAHEDLSISKLAVDMMTGRYPVGEVGIDAEDKQDKERELLAKVIIHDIYVLKNAYVKQKIDNINKQIKEFQADEKKVMELLKQRIELDRLKCVLAKVLGERIVLGISR